MRFTLQHIIPLLKYVLYWVFFFWLAKLLFIIYNLDQTRLLALGEIMGIFGHGFKMDLATACYLLMIPGLLVAMRPLITKKFINSFMLIYTIFFLIIQSALVVLDMGLYPHWGTKVNVTVFNYLDDPVAMQASVSISDVILGLFASGALIAAFIFLYKKLFPEGLFPEGKPKWHTAFLQIFLVATLIIPIRGGLDTSPLNLSSVAFSPKLYVNQAATNFLWNFAKSVEKRKRLSNPCDYMTKEESLRIFNDNIKKDTIINRPHLIRPISGKQPNVILIILESFSNKVISSLGGLHNISPNLDSLCTTSTIFTNFYSTGNRSDRGISAIMGGYPSLLSTSIMVYPEKARSLTLLPEYFEQHNYNTSFYYGGDINFYNLKTFILQSKCDKITTKADFPSELGRMSKWGVPDAYVFDRATEDLKTEKEPFMKTIYTISSHPPYDVPFSKIKGNSVEEKYLNSVAYTDSSLGRFIDEFRKSPLWENTLLIVTSDHGTLPPGPTDITDPASYRIPLIWTGGVADSIQQIETITMQADFGTSLIHQLGWKSDSTRFSKDFFTSHPHAFYALDSGWGYVVPEGFYYFDQGIRNFVPTKANEGKSVDLNYPKAFMQILHDDFISR